MKQKQAPFGSDLGPDNVPMAINGIVRSNTTNARQGKSAITRATGTPKVANANADTANPYAGSSWDGHDSPVGF